MGAVTFGSDGYSYLQELVYSRSAIVLNDSKSYLFESRLMPLALALGHKSTGEFVSYLLLTRDRKLEEQVVEAMTTNETLWFRDKAAFGALREHIIPEVVAAKGTNRQLSIWSAASSSGQELYSVTIMLREHFPQLGSWRLNLLGTDLSKEMIERATSGVYSAVEINRGLPAQLLERYFRRSAASYELDQAVRNSARFQQMNLAADSWAIQPAFDIVLLRNVLIYFDIETKRRILAKIRRQLVQGGYLLLGAAETIAGLSDDFETIASGGAAFYRAKKGSG